MNWAAVAFLAAVTCGILSAGAEERVDLLVVGGSVDNVRVAAEAARKGEKVLLATAWPYLGDDMAATLELGFGGGVPDDTLLRRMWTSSSDLAPFDYTPDRRSDGIRHIYHNDRLDRLSEPGRPPSPADSVWYTGDVSFKCRLRGAARVSTVEVLVLTTRKMADDGVTAEQANDPSRNTLAATASVEGTVAGGSADGRRLVFRNCGRAFTVRGDYYRGDADAVSFVADVDEEIGGANLVVRQDSAASRQLVSRIWFHRAGAERTVSIPTPLKVKRVLDAELLDAGASFITLSPVRRVFRSADGTPEGVELVNRSGRRVVRARRVVGVPAAPDCASIGEVKCSRVVVAAGRMPPRDGVSATRLDERFPIPNTSTTGIAWRCSFSMPLGGGTYPEIAAAEWEARELTRAPGLLDAAARLSFERAPAPRFASNDEPLPEWGSYDIVVAGGGTGGVPAAIAAARSGAKTLLVECLGVLGGVGTDGMILGYYDGNHCGFTEEFKAANKRFGGMFGLNTRAETWRALCREAGVAVWLGAAATGVVKDGSRVVGLEVSTPYGTGVVRGSCFIDATGNSDVAAAAGARTEFLPAAEFALQSAGQSPRRLGRGGINSDFGFVDDSNAEDVSRFAVRARAGAPDAWDIASLPDSRERRRIVPDYLLNAQDVAARRPFPDVVVQARSRQDSHGYLADDFRFLSAPSAVSRRSRNGKEMTWQFYVNVPLRSLLPAGVGSLAVVGLGSGVARDVLPMVRMQADVMNMGYSVGVAAALASRSGGDFRAIDAAELRARLVEKGILRSETLGWEADMDVSSDTAVANAVASMGEAFVGSDVVFRPENRARALPLLRAAFAAAKSEASRQNYAEMLGFLGDATGAELLADIVSGRRKAVRIDRRGAFGGGGNQSDGFLVALGRTRAPCAVEPVAARLRSLRDAAHLPPVDAVRGPTLAAEALGSPLLAPLLAECLKKPGNHGFSRSDAKTLPPLGGYGLGPDMDDCLRELAYARALLACGDFAGLGRRTYEQYASDARGVLSAHAKAILARHKSIP